SDLAKIENSTEYLAALEEKKMRLQAEARALADRLTAHRRAVSHKLEKAVAEVLAFLDMPKVQFSVSMQANADLTPTGRDDMEFFISTNPSEPPAPLIKIASGGELSRIMLALRNVFLDKEGAETLIFDEIDTGISGKTSQKVGIKLRQLSRGPQVLCITHSPQIAALADEHFRIEKHEVNGRNETALHLLDDAGRVEEVARILGGIHVTETQRRSAKELIEDGKKY
ncbi:MAG: DNA repair protein RecN, partial [Clostridia bacterium]|nr:DNA repair protein RecN [Clostridia bacterium]